MKRALPLMILAFLAGLTQDPALAGVDEWTSEGPFGGTVSVLARAPSDPDVVYAGAFAGAGLSGFVGGGVFRSAAGGASWSATGLAEGNVQALAVDPLDPATLYAGMHNGGLWKSADGGLSWSAVSALAGKDVRALALDPEVPGVVYAGTTGSQLWKSTDGGASWLQFGSGLIGSVTELVTGPAGTSTLFAVASPRLHRSFDGGVSWTAVDSGLPDSFTWALALAPSDPSVVYVSKGRDGFFRSDDDAATWTAVSVGVSELDTVYSLAVDPVDAATLYAGTSFGVFTSADGGVTWSRASAGLGRREVLALLTDPRRASTVLAGTRNAGVFTSASGGERWAESNQGLVGSLSVNALVVDPDDPSALYAATSGGLFRRSGATSWTNLSRSLADVSVWGLAIDPTDPAILYAATGCCLVKSTDRGATWTESGAGLRFPPVFAVVMDPTDPAILYVGMEGGVWKTFDGAASWTHVSQEIASFVQGLVIEANDPLTLYALAEEVWKTTDGGASWTPLRNLGTGIVTLVVDPTDSSVLHAGGVGFATRGLFTSFDGGASWSAAADLAGREVLTLAFDPGDSTVLYAGTSDGVVTSSDGGASWSALEEGGLAVPAVSALTVAAGDEPTLYAGTRGGGVFGLTRAVPCGDAEALCLNGGRYLVEVSWRDFRGRTGVGKLVSPPSEDSALLWFFSPSNWEMLVKVLDGCHVNGRVWVFAAATTTVEYTLRVTDTETDAVRTYFNPLGRSAAAVTDGAAFDSCSP